MVTSTKQQRSVRRVRYASLLLLAGVGCASSKRPAADAGHGPLHQRASDASERVSVAVTIYNQDFGLVREVRNVELGEGRVALAYRDVAATIQPETVHIKGLDRPSALTVLEQNYRFDLLTPETLLKKYLGKVVRVYRYNESTGREDEKSAEVLAVEGGTVLRIDGQVTMNYQGRFAFPTVPENLVEKPTLVWLLASSEPQQRLEVTYLTHNLNWAADYVLVIDAEDERGDLTGWVTLSNTSGASYENAKLKLVAGDVQRVEPPADSPQAATMEPMARPAGPPQFKEEGFFEYHLYSLERPTDLLDKEQKQVSLLEAHGVGLLKKLIFKGTPRFFHGAYPNIDSNRKVGVYFDIKNEEKNQLGMPLPKGTLRVYKADRSGAQQFVGEDAIDHTPRDEEIRVKLGEAFDVVADRKQLVWRQLGSCASESSWQVELRNHKDRNEVVEVEEPASGDWEVVDSSHAATREDAETLTFQVPVGARSKSQLTYTLRVRWC